MQVSNFARAAVPDAHGQLDISNEWNQGRGIYGGVPSAAMVHAMQRALDRPEAVLRTLTVHCCRPLQAGPSRVSVSPIRVGRRVAQYSASVTQGGLVTNQATASFASSRTTADLSWVEVRMPSVPPALDIAPVAIDRRGGPRFAQFFEYRFVPDVLPMSGSSTARLQTWIRPKDCAVMDALHVVGILDAGAPAVLSRLTKARAMASVDFRMQLFGSVPLQGVEPEAHWFLDTHARVVGDGYSEQMTWLFAPDGRPIGTCQQLIAIFDGAM